MNPLTFNELLEAFKNNQSVYFHTDFAYEEWKDGIGEIKLTDVVKFCGMYFVGYKCLNSNCKFCNSNHISNSVFGHHQVIKEDGFHIYKKVEFIETKKKTIINELENPVFIRKGN